MNHRHRTSHASHIGHIGLESWVTEVAARTTWDEIVWCDGSQGEWDRLTGELIRKGTFVRLNPELRPNGFLTRSDPSDVARMGKQALDLVEQSDGFVKALHSVGAPPELLRVDPVEWQTEADSVACHFMAFDRLPPRLWDHLRRLRQGLAALPCEEPVGRRPAG